MNIQFDCAELEEQPHIAILTARGPMPRTTWPYAAVIASSLHSKTKVANLAQGLLVQVDLAKLGPPALFLLLFLYTHHGGHCCVRAAHNYA